MIRIDSNVLQFKRFFSRSYSFESGTDSSPLVRFSLHRRAIFGLALLRSFTQKRSICDGTTTTRRFILLCHYWCNYWGPLGLCFIL